MICRSTLVILVHNFIDPHVVTAFTNLVDGNDNKGANSQYL
jgi:hypothetical protein